MSELEKLFTHYGTDKGIWGYTKYYEELMAGHRFGVKKVLEIGICGHRDIPNNVVGASLFVWCDYFPNATIYGVDNDGQFIFNDQDRIITRLANAYDEEQMTEVMKEFGGDFDMIVDDAVHDPYPQIQLMNFLAPYLSEKGVYFMEDVCPYKVEDGDLDRGFYDHIKGYGLVNAGSSRKPEVLLMGMR